MSTTHRRHLTLAPLLEGLSVGELAVGELAVGEGTPIGEAEPVAGARQHARRSAGVRTAELSHVEAEFAVATETLIDVAETSVGAQPGGLLQVGELAKATGKTVRAIHLYEDLGLIEPARRSKGRYRLFAPEAKVRVRWISKLQSLGLSLTEIQAIVVRRQSSESARRAAAELGEVYRKKLEEVRKLMREYRALEAELEASLGFLETCSSSCESELSSLCCSQCTKHPVASPDKAPDLVVGARIA